MRILVTGFSPFGEDTVNASLTAVTALGARPRSDGVDLVPAELPVVFATAPAALDTLIERHRPDAVLAVGEAGGRHAITPEAVGHNLIEARIADNAGARPHGEPVTPDGPAIRECRLPLDPVVTALRAAGLAAHRSDDAGRFVCNQLAYHLYGQRLPAVFVHVPALRPHGRAGVGAETDPATAGVPAPAAGLTTDDLVAGLATCVDALVAHLAAGPPHP